MATFSFDVQEFDIEEFIKCCLTELGKKMESAPTDLVTIVDQDGYSTLVGDLESEKRDLTAELIDSGHRLYFPFALGFEDPAECIDGHSYIEDEIDDEDDTLVSESQSLGFRVAVTNGRLEFVVSVYNEAMLPSAPTVSPVENAGVFERPMADFVSRFVST